MCLSCSIMQNGTRRERERELVCAALGADFPHACMPPGARILSPDVFVGGSATCTLARSLAPEQKVELARAPAGETAGCVRSCSSLCDLISDESDQQVCMRIWKCCCLFAPCVNGWGRVCAVGQGCFDPSCQCKS